MSEESTQAASSSSQNDVEESDPSLLEGIFFVEKGSFFSVLHQFFINNQFEMQRFPMFLRDKVEIEEVKGQLDSRFSSVEISQREILRRINFEKTQIFEQVALTNLRARVENPAKVDSLKTLEKISDRIQCIPEEIFLIYVWCKVLTSNLASRNISVYESSDVLECQKVFGEPSSDFEIKTWKQFWAIINNRQDFYVGTGNFYVGDMENIYVIHDSLLLHIINESLKKKEKYHRNTVRSIVVQNETYLCLVDGRMLSKAIENILDMAYFIFKTSEDHLPFTNEGSQE